MTNNGETTNHAPAAMAMAIGKFIQNFNVLDNRLDYVLGILLNREDIAVGEIVGAALLFDNKRKLVKALVHYIAGADAVTAYKNLDASMKEINTFRNQIVHGEQWIDFEGALRQRGVRITDKGYSPRHTSYSPKEVLDCAAKASDLEIDLWEHFRELLSEEETPETTK